jgi:hypothetical protein
MDCRKKADILSGMNEEELRELIIKRLVNHTRISDIAQEVSEQSGLYWSDAEALVREVALMQEHTIHQKRSPMLAALAVATFLGGMVMLIMTVFAVSNVIVFYRTTQPELLSTINILLFIANEAQLALWLGLFGLAMVSGSLLGMRDVWMVWLDKLFQ